MENFLHRFGHADPDPRQLLNRSQRLRMADVAKATGVSEESWMHHAVNLFLDVEAPVILAEARA